MQLVLGKDSGYRLFYLGTDLVTVPVQLFGRVKPAATLTIVPNANLHKLVQLSNDLKTFEMLVQSAGLVPELSYELDQLTLFAPNNLAFESMDPTAFAGAMSDASSLQELLQFHMVRGRFDITTDPAVDSSLVTILGEQLTLTTLDAKQHAEAHVHIFDRNGGDLGVIVRSNINATNGVIHVVDRVLIPPTATSTVARLNTSAPAVLRTDAPTVLTVSPKLASQV